ncbi:hypothetical protein Glove_43g45 [Diversispora epigaea]|uniref:Uncharacterized protein n=1 Tax=Diversispora epigaea TaxID=1348612 RepID=A0A397JEU4_9GLOM|nr:hypothetical protein Glove_43g45 [Diversispora epigaea]
MYLFDTFIKIQYEQLLTSININNIHPPLETEMPMPMLLGYSVEKECKRIGEFNAILIGRATNHLWNTSTSQEKGNMLI